MHEAELELYRFRVRVERLRLAIARRGPKERKMREVRGLAENMRGKIAALRAEAARAADEFNSEHAATTVSIGKVKSLTKDLKSARQEVDSLLGEGGSNFPTQEELSSSQPEKPLPTGAKADHNGVTVSRG